MICLLPGNHGNFILAPIVQRIEHQPSKLDMGVRFPLGVPVLAKYNNFKYDK